MNAPFVNFIYKCTGGSQVRDYNDVMIGGIGVSGSTIEIDAKVADAAKNAVVLDQLRKIKS